MKPEQLYEHLKELAERMQITVTEHNFRNAGLPVKSGPCKVKGEALFIMDKHLPVRRKNRTLASHLAAYPREEIYMMPAVRDYLKRHSKND